MAKPIQDPFLKIYAECNTNNFEYKMQNPIAIPRYMDIELTNHCNFHCLMCPTGNGMAKRPKGFMSDEIFNLWFEQIKPYKLPIRFIRWGEPLLHPKFIEYVKKLKAEGILVHINTNGKLLDKKMCKEMIDVGLDSIKFSFQGIDRNSYREMRNIDFFSELLERIEMLYDMRGDLRSPYIHISTTTTYETNEQIESFRKRVQMISDKVSVGKTMLEHLDIERVSLPNSEKHVLQTLKEKESVTKVHFKCMEVFDKLSIDWDGTVTACCGDYDRLMSLGNIKENTLDEMWKSKKMNNYRKLLATMQHKKIPLCSKCYENIELTKGN